MSENQDKPPLSSKATDAVAVLVSLLTGGIASRLYMKRTVLTNFRNLGAFEGLKEGGVKSFTELQEKVAVKQIDRLGAAEKIKGILSKKQDIVLNMLHVNGAETMAEQWKNLLYKHQKVQTIAFGAAAATVMLGTIFVLTERVAQRYRDEHSSPER